MRRNEFNRIDLSNSSFLNAEKDLEKIVKYMMTSDALIRLLLLKEDDYIVTDEDRAKVLYNNIRTIPKVDDMNTSQEAYIVVLFDDFMPTDSDEHRNKILHFDIICNVDTWKMGNFQLRPYKIAGIIDSMFSGSNLAGGTYTINFEGASNIALDMNIAGMTLLYSVTYLTRADYVR